jgi:hypothetical protein
MDSNQKVKVYNTTLSLKGVPGTYITVHEEGFYELYMSFNGKRHNVYMPINGTVLVSEAPVEEGEGFGEDVIVR